MFHLMSGLDSGPNLIRGCLCPGGTTKLPAAGSRAAAARPIMCGTCPLSWPMLLQGLGISHTLCISLGFNSKGKAADQAPCKVLAPDP